MTLAEGYQTNSDRLAINGISYKDTVVQGVVDSRHMGPRTNVLFIPMRRSHTACHFYFHSKARLRLLPEHQSISYFRWNHPV